MRGEVARSIEPQAAASASCGASESAEMQGASNPLMVFARRRVWRTMLSERIHPPALWAVGMNVGLLIMRGRRFGVEPGWMVFLGSTPGRVRAARIVGK